MERAKVNGVELEYEVYGQGEPVLLISTGPIADSFLPFLSQKALAERYQLIMYHQRGQAGSTRSNGSVSFKEHAADAAGLLAYLGIRRAHVAGHSTGGVIALQLAADRSEVIHSLTLLEPLLMDVPGAGAFLEKARPIFAAYGSGDREGAMMGFISAVCSLDWETCRTLVEKHVPGGVAQVIKDTDNFFAGYVPALQGWRFGPKVAGVISQPVLSILGTESQRLFAEGRDLLHSWFSQVEDCTVEGVGHLLHMQCPEAVARGVAEFLDRHPINGQSSKRGRQSSFART